MPLLRKCLVYVLVGVLVYNFVLCVAVLGVSVGAEAAGGRPSRSLVISVNIEHYFSRNFLDTGRIGREKSSWITVG
jgi:hypothetical protein